MKKHKKRKKSPAAAFCSILGTVMLAVLVAVCIPLIVPKAMGYQLYAVVSGSMEPAIPTGSLVYVKYIEPGEIAADDVIAFYGTDADGSIITHRVVSNSEAMGQFITKGDANEENDLNPIPYANYIGRVERTVPKVGGIAQTATGEYGRIAAVSVIALAIVLEVIAAMIEKRRSRRAE